jgi:hypothetical protein
MVTVNFGFKNDSLRLTDEELKKAESGSFGAKLMEQGVHQVRITAAEWHVGKETKTTACRADPTWHTVKIVYQNAVGEVFNHYLQVPTSKLTFTINTKAGGQKESPFMFVKFRSFCAGIGELASPDAKLLTSLMKRLFADPSKLIGKELEITLGYQGCYAGYIGGAKESATYSIMNRDGTILDPGPYSKEDVERYAVTKHKKTLYQLEITNIFSTLRVMVI